ncbi:hypothetical protein Tco_0655368 [Tanacetum coccineum]|uniref:Uncharacterized protein n=1 Tax=Tanacetum coccineum TaxID=301880 RepID=A0ABQ4X5T8_9ASTR
MKTTTIKKKRKRQRIQTRKNHKTVVKCFIGAVTTEAGGGNCARTSRNSDNHASPEWNSSSKHCSREVRST